MLADGRAGLLQDLNGDDIRPVSRRVCGVIVDLGGAGLLHRFGQPRAHVDPAADALGAYQEPSRLAALHVQLVPAAAQRRPVPSQPGLLRVLGYLALIRGAGALGGVGHGCIRRRSSSTPVSSRTAATTASCAWMLSP